MSYACRAKGLEKSFRLNTGQAASCCKSYTESFDQNLPELLELWQQESERMSRGEAVASCEQCWRDEAAGKTSLRQTLNAHPALENKIDIYISNLCNHMCSYCSPKFSSMWQRSIEQQGEFELISRSARENQSVDIRLGADQEIIDRNLEQIRQYVKQQPDNSVVISLLGGEPLMQHRGLNRILEFDQQKVKRLVIITNLAPPSSKFLNQILDRVDNKRLLLHISLDTAPAYNHIPRHGFDQKQFEKHFALIQDRGIEHTVLSTVSALSAFTLPQFELWCTNNNIQPTFQSLQNPACLQVAGLPKSVKQRIYQSVDPAFLNHELHWQLTTPDPARVQQIELYNYLRQYFARTGTQTNTFPLEMQRWWNELSKNCG